MYAGNSLYNQVTARCPDFWNKWSCGFCVIPLWWNTCSLNKLTHKIYLVMYLVIIINKKSNLTIYVCNDLYNQVAARCPYLWNKWSWGFCVIPLWWITCSLNKLTDKISLVMYLVIIINKKLNLTIYVCNCLYNQVAARCPDFWNKWSWGFCVIPLWFITYCLNKLAYKTYLVRYLVSIIKIKSQICRFMLVTVYITKLQPNAPTFEINCHEASVWSHHDVLRNVWTNWPINLSGNVFGYSHKQKLKFDDLCL